MAAVTTPCKLHPNGTNDWFWFDGVTPPARLPDGVGIGSIMSFTLKYPTVNMAEGDFNKLRDFMVAKLEAETVVGHAALP